MYDIRTFENEVTRWKEESTLEYETPEDEPLKPQYVVDTYDELGPEDTIVTSGVGQHQVWAWQYWMFTEPRTWVTSNRLGRMGYGLPAAIGTKVAAPDREVVTSEGDGSFLITNQKLAVSVRENLGITVVVLNNDGVGMIRQWQDSFYDGRRTASEYPWVPQFDKLAEAYGARGLRLEGYDEVEEKIQMAREYDGLSVIDVLIAPDEDVFPIVPAGGDNSQFVFTEEQLDALE